MKFFEGNGYVNTKDGDQYELGFVVFDVFPDNATRYEVMDSFREHVMQKISEADNCVQVDTETDDGETLFTTLIPWKTVVSITLTTEERTLEEFDALLNMR